MKLAKSLLLGAAAGIVGVAAAQAADLPSRIKGPAIEYVRICDAYGTGFFYLPGTETCLKVHGYVRAEYTYTNVARQLNPGLTPADATYGATVTARAQDNNFFHARAVMKEDSRTLTAYGVLRTFGSIQVDNTGRGGSNGNSVSLDKAYIQWAGITAGRAQSMFDFYADALDYFDVRGSDASTNLLAYTAVFGGGFSATVSIEDHNQREQAPAPNHSDGFVISRAGTRAPDVVAMVNLTQGWGQVQFSAAAHQNTTQTSSSVGSIGKNKFGYAFQAGVEINLPMLAAGDQLWIQGAYAKGALDYIGVGPNQFGTTLNGAGIVRTDGDVYVIQNKAGTSYKLGMERGFSVLGAFRHNFTPTVGASLVASYVRVTPGKHIENTDWTEGGLGKFQEYRAGLLVDWTPVSGFTIGVEGMYSRVKQTLGHDIGVLAPSTTVGGVSYKKDYNSYMGRLRLNRSF